MSGNIEYGVRYDDPRTGATLTLTKYDRPSEAYEALLSLDPKVGESGRIVFRHVSEWSDPEKELP